MILEKRFFFVLLVINLSFHFSINTFAQNHYIRSPHVVYDVTSDGNNYIINYTFKDHYNNLQNYTLKLPVSFTDGEIDAFGIPLWLFEPYIDNDCNRMIRKQEMAKGLFMINKDVIEVDKSAVIERYAETFCKPIAGLIVQSLEEYGRDTRRDRIEFAIRFVQDIPYGIPDYADKKRHFGGVSPPPGVLRNGYGDCDSKVLLFAGILIYLIPSNDFIFLNQPKHVLSAISEEPDKELNFVKYMNRDYLIAETAGPGRKFLGEKGQYFDDKFKVEALRIVAPEIIPYKTQVTSSLPYAPELPYGKNYLVIQNSSEKDFNFQISVDNIHWKEFTLHQNNSGNYKFDSEITVFLKIREKNSAAKVYKVNTGKAYRFSYHAQEKLWEPG
jgi:hypothetical protein